MIIGIGTDLLEIERIARILEGPSGKRFLERVLTQREWELAKGRQARLAEFTAGRFAAKEAVSKALGCGIGPKLSFLDIEAVPDEQGKPVCRVSDKALLGLGLSPETTRLHLSITHSTQMAMAYVIAEQA